MVTKSESSNELKVEEKSRDYEVVLIINPELEGEKLDATVNKLSQFITDRGGVISEVKHWGKRKLSYSIKHFMEGNYVLVLFKSKASVSRELEANMHIYEEVMRYLLIKVES